MILFYTDPYFNLFSNTIFVSYRIFERTGINKAQFIEKYKDEIDSPQPFMRDSSEVPEEEYEVPDDTEEMPSTCSIPRTNFDNTKSDAFGASRRATAKDRNCPKVSRQIKNFRGSNNVYMQTFTKLGKLRMIRSY